MKINKEIRSIEVYYDGSCAMCSSFKHWLERQKHLIGVELLSYASKAAIERFPDLATYEPEKAIVVRTGTGEIYLAAEATVICLWACCDYRRLAQKLSKPLFLPLARKIYPLIANNRYAISKLLIADNKLPRELEKQTEGCKDNSCEFE